jgi:hypothetical protein
MSVMVDSNLSEETGKIFLLDVSNQELRLLGTMEVYRTKVFYLFIVKK